jgi:hypothetical protein
MDSNQEGFFKLFDLKFTSINLLGFSFISSLLNIDEGMPDCTGNPFGGGKPEQKLS